MTWLDIIAIVLIAVGAGVETKRGFTQGLFDFVVAVACLYVAKGTGESFSQAIHVGPVPGTLLLFFVVLAAGLVASHFMYQMLHWSLEAFDPLLGLVFGAATGIAVSHLIFWVLGEKNPAVAHSAFADEILRFGTYHGFLNFMQNLGKYD